MSLLGSNACLLESEDFNFYEEERIQHVSSRSLFTSEKRGKRAMEAEKRIRREIANSNERRRMQSINAGFQSLRTLLPRHEGEKLSKAAILQQTAEYIYSLEQEKTRLLSQNCQLKRLLNQHEGGEIPFKKRKNNDTTTIPDSTEEKSTSPEPNLKKEQAESPSGAEELRVELEKERRARAALEDRVRALEATRTSLYQKIKQEPQESTIIQVEEPASVEIEVEPSACPKITETVSRVDVEKLYLASTSRQNLETIVEAIRHLEGDHLFAEDAPLALTTRPAPPPPPRPGVIVVKHS